MNKTKKIQKLKNKVFNLNKVNDMIKESSENNLTILLSHVGMKCLRDGDIKLKLHLIE